MPAVRRAPKAVLVLAALLLLSGCSVRPRTSIAPARSASFEEIKDALGLRRNALHGLRTLARLRYRDSNGTQSARQALIVERPARLRMEILSLVGPVFVLATDGVQLTAFEPSEGRFYRGRATTANLARYAHLAVPLSELLDILLATPQLPEAASITMGRDDNTQATTVSATAPHGELRLWWLPPAGLVAAERRDSDGTVLWHTTYAAHGDVGGTWLATAISIDVPTSGQHLELELREPDVNPTLDPGLFALQTPADATVVDLDAELM